MHTPVAITASTPSHRRSTAYATLVRVTCLLSYTGVIDNQLTRGATWDDNGHSSAQPDIKGHLIVCKRQSTRYSETLHKNTFLTLNRMRSLRVGCVNPRTAQTTGRGWYMGTRTRRPYTWNDRKTISSTLFSLS